MTDELLSLALSALDDQSYDQLINKLFGAHGNDQKAVAQALQELAKAVERARSAESAFEFKQRSCETFLRINMQARNAARNPSAQDGAAQTTRSDAPSESNRSKQLQASTTAVSTVAPDLLSACRNAIQKQDNDDLMIEVIKQLEEKHNNNQREVAAALQQIARALEHSCADDAIAFKQLSCAAMLKLSMQSRQRNKN